MAATDGLQFGGRVPARGGDVDARRLLQVQPLAAALDLNHEHARRRLFELRDHEDPGLLFDRPVDAKHELAHVFEAFLDEVDLFGELTKDERLFSRVLEDHLEERGHLVRPVGPPVRLVPTLPRDAVQVQLRVDQDLTHAQEALEDVHEHLPGVGPSHDLPDPVARRREDARVQLEFLGEHVEFDVLKVARRQLEPRVVEGRPAVAFLLGPPKDVRVPDLRREPLHGRLTDPDERAQGHKVPDGVVDGGTRQDPPDRRREVTATFEDFGPRVSDLVALVEDDSTPDFLMETRVLLDQD